MTIDLRVFQAIATVIPTLLVAVAVSSKGLAVVSEGKRTRDYVLAGAIVVAAAVGEAAALGVLTTGVMGDWWFGVSVVATGVLFGGILLLNVDRSTEEAKKRARLPIMIATLVGVFGVFVVVVVSVTASR